jgi:uncharacterized protein with HEPN domain
MSRRSRLFLEDITESCKRIQKYSLGISFEQFSSDERTIDAIVRNLEIIGEAVKNPPPELMALKPEIDWKKIARFRDVVVHHYFKVDLEVVWDIVENKISSLDEAAAYLLTLDR